ncbi:phenylacetate-CoA oxygenase/reductase, PaaK subunit [Raoultella terrigena]|uniref:Phenylacetate-CoA oxygenase/reductase, PaaK subunit n=1 Tax=Raoultella terrigena TaxID=577 RepID=A0A3P8KLR1_RAOTE|nr:phenylacetate-CoA oxygenase/reductase, PaaK subunit [Raoultella terrigena]
MTTFHSLTVARVEPETRDAVTITFAIPDALQAEYAFRPGQHLTVKARLGGEELRPLLLHLPQPLPGRNQRSGEGHRRRPLSPAMRRTIFTRA